ncbi:MAG: sodium:solute symporter family protein, partial [Pseudomonadota bacterium]
LVVALMQVLVYGMGGIINLGKADIEPYEHVTIWASLNLLPPFLGAIMLAGVMAAALSSASTFLSLVGFSASNDIGLHSPGNKSATLRFSRVMMLVAGAVALGAALVFPPDIFWLMLFIGTVFASAWGPVAMMSIWSRRITEAAAFWGMLAGVVFNVVPKFFEFIGVISIPVYLDPALTGALASLAVILIVSRFTAVTPEEAQYLARLHETPADEVDRGRTARTLLAPAALLVVNGVVMPVLLMRYYVLPFQAARDELSPDGTLNWLSGEALMVMSWSLIYVALAVAVSIVIWREYAAAGARQSGRDGPPTALGAASRRE